MTDMTLYVAGPMTGYPEFNYPAFIDAEKALIERGYRVLNPVTNEPPDAERFSQERSFYMRHAIEMLLEAQGVALLPQWHKSRGASLEFNIAKELGLITRPLHGWLNPLVTAQDVRVES